MIADFLDQRAVGGYVAAMKAQLAAGTLDDKAPAAAAGIGRGSPDQDPKAAVQAVLDALPDDNTGQASSGGGATSSPFYSRAPMVSLLQTSLEDEARKSGIVRERKPGGPFGHIVGAAESIEHTIDSILHPTKFSTDDPDWVTRIAAATLDRIAKGNRAFNPTPAEHEISDGHFRVLVVGDWGSGLPHACMVSALMAAEVEDALAKAVPIHVIHLGDVYYSGDPVEVQRRVLADGMWPVSAEQDARGVTSWALNGNHDMYCGGWGFYDTLLADERFQNQHSPDGQPTSFFRIRTPAWDLVGLDTSWDSDVLTEGQSAVLADPQAAIVQGWAAEAEHQGRKLMLMSHHQFVTAYDQTDIGPVLGAKLAPLLEGRQITAWLWGHEHRCVGLEAQEIPFARCIGHGGIPVLVEDTTTPLPKPGLWQETGSFPENGSNWHKFGFAVLEFNGPDALITYRDDDGTSPRSEPVT
jgi:hypothetical protein